MMDDDYEIIMSPLCREVTRDGTTVEIMIYRGEHDDDWDDPLPKSYLIARRNALSL